MCLLTPRCQSSLTPVHRGACTHKLVYHLTTAVRGGSRDPGVCRGDTSQLETNTSRSSPSQSSLSSLVRGTWTYL
jgi:hypothetical protein